VPSTDSPDPIPTSERRTIGANYEVIEELGRGPGTVLFAARNAWTGREVTIELVERGADGDSGLRKRFIKEARLAARLTHPNIVSVLDLGDTEDGSLFIVQERLVGERLSERLERDGTLSFAEATALVLPILRALVSAHAIGIVHGGLSAEHIMLAQKRRGAIVPKLLDLGLAQDLERDGLTRLTVAGHGTPGSRVVPPEQVSGRGVGDPRADVWSAFAVLYRCLTGHHPYEATTLPALIAKMTREEPFAVSAWAPHQPASVDALFRRGLARDPDERFSTMREAIGAIETLLESLGDEAALDTGDDTVEMLDTRGLEATAPMQAGDFLPDLRFGLVVTSADVDTSMTAAVIGASLGRRCEVLRFFDYRSLVDAVGAGELDLAWLPPVAYARARQVGAAQRLVSVERAGRASYACALLGRRGVVDRIEQAAGRRAAWVDEWSAAGYLVPRALLREAGVDPDTQLGSQGLVGSYEAVLRALTQGSAEIGASYCQLDGGRVVAGAWGATDPVRVLATHGPIPGDTICCRSDLSLDDVKETVTALTDPERSAPLRSMVGASRFVLGDSEGYAELESALERDG